MFAFLGTAYSVSIRLGPVQDQAPMRTGLAFVLLNGIALVMLPADGATAANRGAGAVAGLGLLLIAAGDYWAATLPITDTAFTSLILPLGLVGLGFAITVSSITATAVNTVPVHLAGMASATTNLLRDFGFTLGPAIIGAWPEPRGEQLLHLPARLRPARSTERRGHGRIGRRAAHSRSTAPRRHPRSWPTCTRSPWMPSATAIRSASWSAALPRCSPPCSPSPHSRPSHLT